MASRVFEDIVETFDFIDDWEDRYRHLIEMGKALPSMDENFKVQAYKVEGCTSQVWLRPLVDNKSFDFQADSDGMIVRGLIAILHALYSGLRPEQVLKVDAKNELARLGLNDHLSAQRSNGLRAMIEHIRAAVQK